MKNEIEIEVDKLKALRTVVLEGSVPSSLSKIKESTLQKINDRIAYLDELFYEDEDILRMPSMAILKISHTLNEEPQYYFHTDLSSQSEAQIEIYSASMDKKTGKPIREKLIHKLVMTEKQFGDLMVNHNRANGMPLTIEVMDGKVVGKFDADIDITKNKMRNIRNASDVTNQTDRFARELQELVDKCDNAGRANKSDITEINKITGMMLGNFTSNARYSIGKLSSETNKRIVEAGVNTHFSVNQIAAIGGHKLTLENKTEGKKDD